MKKMGRPAKFSADDWRALIRLNDGDVPRMAVAAGHSRHGVYHALRRHGLLGMAQQARLGNKKLSQLSRSRAAAREHIIGVLSFARDMNRGYTAETWTSDRACARNDQRVRHFERASGAIQALYIAGLLTTASASRSARLLGAYSFDDEWADMDRRACFDMDEAKLEVW